MSSMGLLATSAVAGRIYDIESVMWTCLGVDDGIV